MITIKIGTKIFINGQSQTIELTVTSLGNKYYHFDNPKYRYIKSKDEEQQLKKSAEDLLSLAPEGIELLKNEDELIEVDCEQKTEIGDC